jgi:hypothetical protein
MKYISSSSDEDTDEEEPSICTINMTNDTCILCSNRCPDDFVPKFTLGSFDVRHANSTLVISLHPMFLWRLIHTIQNTPERTIDTVRLRTNASYAISSNPVVYAVEKGNKYYLPLLDTFNIVCADRYNTPDKTKHLLSAMADIILHKYTT